MKLKKSFILCLILFQASIFLEGCWDMEEIDKKAFISTIAVDVGKDIDMEEKLKKVNPQEVFPEREIKKINVTFGFPDISRLGPGKTGTAEDQFINTEAYSMEDALAKATAKSSRSIYFGDSKLLVLSQSLLHHPEVFREVLDYFARNSQLNRMMYVIIYDGKAQDLVNFKPAMEKNIESYLIGLMENSNRNATILPVKLNELLILLGKNGNAFLPEMNIDKDKKELSLVGLGLIKNYELQGTLNSIETSDVEILRGKLKGGNKAIYYEGHPIDFVIDGINRKISLSKDKNKLVFNINIKLEGSINEYYFDKDIILDNQLQNIEGYFNKSISDECEKVAKLTQAEFQVDPIGLNDFIEKYYPIEWSEIKNNWAEEYKNSLISVKTNVRIRRVGVEK
jgi:spore germination protein